jgi:predicted HAD superfamily Cof-like phosphohydrolase
MKSLKEFHDKFDPDKESRYDRELSVSLINKRRQLIQEEFNEVIDALMDVKRDIAFPGSVHTAADNMEHLAKELADLLYVVYGAAEELHIDLETAFSIVHQSNMDKLWPDGQVHYNEFGKVIKPPTYSPPDMSEVFDVY